MTAGTVFASDLVFPECPRWHDGALWSSDMWGRTVYRYGPAPPAREAVSRFDDEPGGLGWLPDGRMLVVSMERRQVLRLERDRSVSVHADLTELAPWSCNDMIVAGDGTAYVSQFGFDLWGGGQPAPSCVIRVAPDGRVDVGADDLMCPNGMALADDGTTLFVAEAAASRITRFTVRPDGSLTGREVHARIDPVAGLPAAPPDGICLDERGAIWMAEPLGKRVLRVEPGGVITHEVPFELHPTAVVLGNDDRRTLYVCLAAHLDHGRAGDRPGARIDTTRVEIPGAGKP